MGGRGFPHALVPTCMVPPIVNNLTSVLCYSWRTYANILFSLQVHFPPGSDNTYFLGLEKIYIYNGDTYTVDDTSMGLNTGSTVFEFFRNLRGRKPGFES
jgi:hypothetical protein